MRRLLPALACTLAIAGCGSDDSGESGDSGAAGGAPPGELAALVPEGAFSKIAEADFAGARKALDLPVDFDPRDGLDASGPERRFSEAVLPTIPFYVGPQPIPVGKVLDGGLIQSAAAEGEGGASEVIVVRTDQPFEQIAAGLVEAGYKRRGRILNYTGDVNDVRYPEVVAADGDESLIAISGERTRGFAALGAAPAAPDSRPELALLGELPEAPVRIADGELIGAGCASVGVADQLAEGKAELVVLVEGEEASAEALQLDGIAGLEPGELEVSADSIRAPLTFGLETPGAPGTAIADAFPSTIYECEQGILGPGAPGTQTQP